MNLVRSHAVDTGPSLPHRVTRAALAVRLNQLLQGGSGVAPEVVRALAEMLRADALPELREFGSIGTGDLTALSGIALALLGERPTSQPLQALSAIHGDSALPFISSSAVTISQTALTIARLRDLCEAQLGIFALAAVAGRANPEAFAPRTAQSFAIPSAVPAAVRLSAILEGRTWKPARIQDPYAFREFLAAHAVLRTALKRLAEHTEALMNIDQENPLFDVAAGRAYHHGAFYQVALAHELDAVAIALAQNAPLLISRLRFLNDDTFTGLPRFLAPDEGGSSGTMMVEYVAASAMGEMMAASAPISVHSAVMSCGVEEDATFATTASTKLARAMEAYEAMLSAELVISLRALRLRGDKPGSASGILTELLSCVDEMPAGMLDRDLRGDLDLAASLLPAIAKIVRERAPSPAIENS